MISLVHTQSIQRRTDRRRDCFAFLSGKRHQLQVTLINLSRYALNFFLIESPVHTRNVFRLSWRMDFISFCQDDLEVTLNVLSLNIFAHLGDGHFISFEVETFLQPRKA